MRNTFIDTILDACNDRDDIFILSGDAGLGVFDRFKQEHPDRFLNMGVAEQNTISFAAGLALAGHKVLIYNIIPFLLYRCYEQVRNDICYQELPIILAGIGSGVTYAPMGMTHYSVEDVGIARTLPNLAVISPIDPIEAKLAAQYALSSQHPVYVRLAKRGEPNLHDGADFRIDEPQVLRQGDGVALVCHGSITSEVLLAHDLLLRANMRPRVVSVPFLQPLNTASLLKALEGIGAVVAVEEHYANSGLGAILNQLVADGALKARIATLGVPFGFIHEVNDTAGMRRAFGIDAESVAAAARKMSEAKPCHF